MAATTAKKSSSSSSSKTKTTAKSVQKTPANKQAPQAEAVNELREKRAAMDQPVVDTPLAATDTYGETQAQDSKDTIDVSSEGSTITLTLGGKTIRLDREGALSLQRHLDQATAGL